MRTATSKRAALVGCCLLALSGCTDSTGGDDPPPAPSETTAAERSAALVDAVADDSVTYDEYLAGFQRFAGCMEAAGHPLVIGEEINMVIDYAVIEAAVVDGTEERCYEREFAPLDLSWQVQREDSSETTEVLRACLREHDIDPAGTLSEVTAQLDEAGIPVQTCLAS